MRNEFGSVGRRAMRRLVASTVVGIGLFAKVVAQDPAPEPPPISPLVPVPPAPPSNGAGAFRRVDRAVERVSSAVPSSPTAVRAIDSLPAPVRPMAAIGTGTGAFQSFGPYFSDVSAPVAKESGANPRSKAGGDDWLANLRSVEEQTKQKLNWLDEEIRQHPDRAEAFYRRGGLRSQMARSDQPEALNAARADLSRAVALDPGHVEARLCRGYVSARRQDWAEAVADFTWVIEHHPEITIAWAQRGEALMRQGEYDRAIADFDRADGRLKESPEKLWGCRAWCYAAKGLHVKAIADYTRAIENSTVFETWIYTGRAQSYRATQEPDKALADLDRAIAIKPDDATVHFLRADILLAKGDYWPAAEEADRLTELLPNHWGPYFLGSVASWLAAVEDDRDLKNAVWAATIAERLFPCALAPRLVHGWAYSGIGKDRKQALEGMDRCFALEPRLSYLYAFRAFLNAYEGRFLPTCRDLALFVARFDRRNYHFFARVDWENHRFAIGFTEFFPDPETASEVKQVLAHVTNQCIESGLQRFMGTAFDPRR